ncbi:MAG: biotin--[acetyl-CoA-carboxylase] ligase [Armatimonadetes bacterium]|nr:biotin--[acetyl-CoA-carboxylase] ligase [Armatimonadota bacterium]
MSIRLEILESAPSTMDIARENLDSGKITFSNSGEPTYHGVMTYEQTEGRGQRGNSWFAIPQQSLCATFYYRDPYSSPECPQEVSLLAGVAVLEAIQQVIGTRETAPPLGLKWPNDILLNGKKMGGVLIELAKAEDGKWVFLIGTGINLSVPSFPPAIASIATSLTQEGLPSCTCEEMAELIALQLVRFSALRAEEGFSAIRERWRSYDLTRGRKYLYEEAGESRVGIAVGVTDAGHLLLEFENGNEIAVQTASSIKEMYVRPL